MDLLSTKTVFAPFVDAVIALAKPAKLAPITATSYILIILDIDLDFSPNSYQYVM
jgi:hypothetical protein